MSVGMLAGMVIGSFLTQEESSDEERKEEEEDE